MGKKRFDKSTKRRKKVTREDDGALRLTHLWAGAHLLAEHAPSLSRHYLRTTRQICRRINLKTDFVTIKRHVCKVCDTLLMPGLGGARATRVRHVTKPERHVRIVCGVCGTGRRFLTRAAGMGALKSVEAGGGVGNEGGGGDVGRVGTAEERVEAGGSGSAEWESGGGDAGAAQGAEAGRGGSAVGEVKRRSCLVQ